MQVLFLPGFSKSNIEDSQEIKNFLEESGFRVVIHPWIHWIKKKKKEFSVDQEIIDIEKELKTFGDDFGIIAKSIGTWVCIHLIKKLKLKPKFVILMGIPLPDHEDRSKVYSEFLLNSDFCVTVIQNKFDPVCSSEKLKNDLDFSNTKLIEMDDASHKYVYPEKIEEIIKTLRKS